MVCKIDGIDVESILTSGWDGSGRYLILIPRPAAELRDLEKIDWSAPTIEYDPFDAPTSRFPVGCSYEVIELSYSSMPKQWRIEIQVKAQHFGDTTQLSAQLADKDATIQDLQADLAAVIAAYSEGVETIG